MNPRLSAALAFLFLLAAAPAMGEPARHFLMGFSPWPWDATTQAVDWTYNRITGDGDIVSHHIEEGVPWEEALSGLPFSPSFQQELDTRKKKTAGKKLLLQVNALAMDRESLAPYRGDKPNQELPEAWKKLRFNDAKVRKAYISYVKRMIDSLNPDFVVTGIEVNILRAKTDLPTWRDFVDLQCTLYKDLKASGYPQPLSMSFVTTAFYKPDQLAPEYDFGLMKQALKDMEPCLDFVSWSVHPFMSGLLADAFPADYFETVSSLTSKPQAISESSYPAQKWSIFLFATWKGTAEKQEKFLASMLSFAQAHALKFVIWYSIRDYDQLWSRAERSGGLGRSSLALVWRDTGLFDEKGLPRLAFRTWRDWLIKPLSAQNSSVPPRKGQAPE